MMAEKKSIIDFAYPGDIVGLHDTGNFKIGDTFTEGENSNSRASRRFAPEQFRYIENADPLKFKVRQRRGPGSWTRAWRSCSSASSTAARSSARWALQFEVIQYRLEHEYNAARRWGADLDLQSLLDRERQRPRALADFKTPQAHQHGRRQHGRDVFPRRHELRTRPRAGEFQGYPVPLHLGISDAAAPGGNLLRPLFPAPSPTDVKRAVPRDSPFPSTPLRKRSGRTRRRKEFCRKLLASSCQTSMGISSISAPSCRCFLDRELIRFGDAHAVARSPPRPRLDAAPRITKTVGAWLRVVMGVFDHHDPLSRSSV